jgi:predicted restriction endonuclease
MNKWCCFGRLWTKKEELLLMQMYNSENPLYSIKIITDKLDRSIRSLHTKIWEIRKKTSDVLITKNERIRRLNINGIIGTKNRKISRNKSTYLRGKEHGMYGRKHTKESREKMSKTRIESGMYKREKNPNWRGGITPYKKILYDTIFRKNKSELLKEYPFCRICGKEQNELKQGKWLEAAHLVHNTIDNIDNSKENLIILCSDCHIEIDNM